MAVVDVKSVSSWSDAHTNRSEMFNSCCNMSAHLSTPLIRLSKLGADPKFMISPAIRLPVFVRSGFECTGSGVALLDCSLARSRA